MISTYRGGLGDCASLFFKAPGETALRSFEGDKVKLHSKFKRGLGETALRSNDGD